MMIRDLSGYPTSAFSRTAFPIEPVGFAGALEEVGQVVVDV
ncbi:MAG: hypothetical protein ACLU4N_28295 [Butyricimonas faecihominis]